MIKCSYLDLAMTKKDKLFQKFINKPESLSYSDLKHILKHLDFEEITAKGSHVKWKHSMLDRDLVIPIHNKDCKAFYKKQTLKILKNNKLI